MHRYALWPNGPNAQIFHSSNQVHNTCNPVHKKSIIFILTYVQSSTPKKYLLDYSKPKPDKMAPQTTETSSIGASPSQLIP